MKKLLTFLLMLLLLAYPTYATQEGQYNYYFNIDSVVKISCNDNELSWSGSGVIINKNKILTANHVIENAKECTVNNIKAKFVSNDTKLDVAIIEANLGDKQAISKISCDGFTKGDVYLAFGYAFSNDLIVQRLVSSGKNISFPGIKDFSLMKTVIYPGMSGGPIIDKDGKIVGINNITSIEQNIAGSRSLSETALCSPFIGKDSAFPSDE